MVSDIDIHMHYNLYTRHNKVNAKVNNLLTAQFLKALLNTSKTIDNKDDLKCIW